MKKVGIILFTIFACLQLTGCGQGLAAIFASLGIKNGIDTVVDNYQASVNAQTYARAQREAKGADYTKDVKQDAMLTAARENTNWLASGVHNGWTLLSIKCNPFISKDKKEDALKAADTKWAEKRYNKSYKVKKATLDYVDAVNNLFETEQRAKNEGVSEDTISFQDTVKKFLPIILIVIAVIALLVLAGIVKVRSKRPQIMVNTSDYQQSGRRVLVNYNNVVNRECTRLGLNPEEQIQRYGSAQAAAEALQIM